METTTPTARIGAPGIVLCQESRKRDWDSNGAVPGSNRLGHRQLLFQSWLQASRERDHAVLVSFGLMDDKARAPEVHVLNAQVQGLRDTQTACVNEVDDKSRGVARGHS
jgi:hypothetical protein